MVAAEYRIRLPEFETDNPTSMYCLHVNFETLLKLKPSDQRIYHFSDVFIRPIFPSMSSTVLQQRPSMQLCHKLT